MSDKKSIPDPVAALQLWEKGQIRCRAFCKNMALEDIQPLQLVPCASCKEMLFVPKKVGNYFLYEPMAAAAGQRHKGVSDFFPGDSGVKDLTPLPGQSSRHPRPAQRGAGESYCINSDLSTPCLDRLRRYEIFAVDAFYRGRRPRQAHRPHAANSERRSCRRLHILAAEQIFIIWDTLPA